MRCLLLIAVLIFLPGTALGMTFSVPLPDLVGVVDFLPWTGGKEASFDVGQQFSEIQNVWIEIEAQVFAQEYDVCGTPLDPQPCVHQVHLLGFFAVMHEESPIPGFVWSDGLSFSDGSNPLEGYGVDVASFNNPLVGWDFLLHGEGSLTLYWNRELGNPDRIILNVIEPSGEVFDARIIIEGTPVPEPSTALLLAMGLLALAGIRQRE